MDHRCILKLALETGRRLLCGVLFAGVLGMLGAHTGMAAATGKISGRVTDAKTREPLVGVNVTLVGTNRGAATDVQGDFFIANVDPGVYSLRARQVGYNDVIVNDVRVRVDATTEVKFQLQETVLDVGQEVVVTAERPTIQKDNTATRVFVESSEIVNRPATNVADVVATLPSINVENGIMKVRGGTMNEVAFIVDGARARNPMNQEPYTNINLGSIAELEIITGSFNAEYGEARSGIFNVITKEGGERYSFYLDARYIPPGVKHWGASLYDLSSPLYWENAHARHLQWWIDNPDQWVDPNGVFGNDPRSSWTAEQGYQNYLDTHKPLTDYTKTPGYQIEGSLGGPVPGVDRLFLFLSGKYRSEPPVMGNAYLEKGGFFDGTAKISWNISDNTKLLFSGFLGTEHSSWGIGGGPDYFWAQVYGIDSRYAFYDWEGYPTVRTSGQTLKLTHVVDASTMWEVKASRVYAGRKVDAFPDDPMGWEASDAIRDNLRAYDAVVDSLGNVTRVPAPGGNQNRIGYNTTGYYYRFDDKNTDWSLDGYYSSQINKNWQLKAGAEFTYYYLDHYNEAKSPLRTDDNIYTPYQGAGYVHNKLEFGGFIMNVGLRYDFYNPNNVSYSDIFDPLSPTATTEDTKMFAQLSPRLGISHPIDEYTVLHFSYGHFFERGTFGDYGEGNSDEQSLGSLTTFVVNGTTTPWVLGNRNTKPEKTVAYELGVERSFFEEFVLGVTAYYKDIRNTLRVINVESPGGVYRTNGNGDYADVRGLEVTLRKQASRRPWGTTWGYANFTTQMGINGRSGEPVAISPTRVLYAPSGDYIVHNNPRLKAGVYYETPSDWEFLGGLLNRLSLTLDYQVVFPNDQLIGDYFEYGGQKYMRPADQNTNLKIRKDFEFGSSNPIRLGFYVEVRNVFNNKWLNFSAFEACSLEDQGRFATSGFEYIPTYTANGTPILDLAKYRNLPRSYMIGLTLEM
jgi:hypothetical protein